MKTQLAEWHITPECVVIVAGMRLGGKGALIALIGMVAKRIAQLTLKRLPESVLY